MAPGPSGEFFGLRIEEARVVPTYLGLRTGLSNSECTSITHRAHETHMAGPPPRKVSGQFWPEVGSGLGMSHRVPGDAAAAGLATTHGGQLI